MNSVVLLFTILSICLNLCFTDALMKTKKKYNWESTWETAKSVKRCLIHLPNLNTELFPIPFVVKKNTAIIIYPNAEGNLEVKSGQKFSFACPSSRFSKKELSYINELEVECQDRIEPNLVKVNFSYSDFYCIRIPGSTTVRSATKCQNGKGEVISVGFKTHKYFISLYKVCFDMLTKKSLFSWYHSRMPYSKTNHIKNPRMFYTPDYSIYGSVRINQMYNIKVQKKIFEDILQSKTLAKRYIKDDRLHYLSRGHYAAKADFYYFAEQCATYNFANTAPQWHLINSYGWSDFEEKFRQTVSKQYAKLIIVSGTYLVSSLPNVNNISTPLYLGADKNVPVPLFFWKMYYNPQIDKGIVYIGLNNPYIEVNDKSFICPNICPTRGYVTHPTGKEEKNNGLIYCCTKRSFEQVYGTIDKSVYEYLD